MSRHSKIKYNFSGKKEDVSMLLRQFATDSVLKRINTISSDLFINNTAMKLVSYTIQLKRDIRPKRINTLITAWSLIDLAYYSIVLSNDYRGKEIDSDEKIYLLIKAIDNYREREEKQFISSQHENQTDDLYLYFWGFAGEQFKTQELEFILKNMSRELYMLLELNDMGVVNVKERVLEEVGVSWDKVLAYLMIGWFGFTKADTLSEVNKKIDWKYNAAREEFEKVILKYTTNYEEVRKSELERQILYVKPYIRTQHNEVVCVSTYLSIFLCEHSILWIIRDSFKNQLFTNYFGELFEKYFSELLNECLELEYFVHINEDKTEKADWKLIIGCNKFLIEQKSTVLRLSAKQQKTDIGAIKDFAKRTVLKAVSQLNTTEKEFDDGKYIKIILLYEEYLEPELLEQFMEMPECKVDNDNYFWLITIDEAERLFFLCKENRALFDKVVSEKIRREINHSKDGRSLSKILNENGIVNNQYLRNEKFTKYRDIINARVHELI